MFSLSLCYVSRLVATDYHFQAIYDVAMIQVLIFNLYVLIRDSYKAGRYVPPASTLPAICVILGDVVDYYFYLTMICTTGCILTRACYSKVWGHRHNF